MKQYKTIELPIKVCEHDACLNKYADEGWEVKLAYGTQDSRIILEKSKLVEKVSEEGK